MKELAKSILEKSKSFVYHREQNAAALKIRKAVESQKGKLSTQNKKLCTEYAQDIFGNKKYAPWLMTYCSYTNEFKEGWIPDNYYGETVIPLLKGEYGKITDMSLVLGQIINDEYSSDIGYFINGLFLNTNSEVIEPNDIKELLFEKNDRIVYKLESSFQGKGILFFDKESFSLKKIRNLGNGVFQKFIRQHPFFDQFNKSAVGTIRLTTVLNNNAEVELRAGYFRFGRTGDTHVMSSRQMRIPINIEKGCLWNKKVAFYPSTKFTDTLPDNNIDFAGLELPYFKNCVEEIKKMHSAIPYIRCIGWDLIVDDNNNLRIIELNGNHNGITLSEMVQGPCFKGLGWENLHKQ